MGFRFVEIEIAEGEDGADLIEEYDKLKKIHEATGDKEKHGHSIVCQIFSHKDSDRKFFLSGRVLNKEESDAFAKILGTDRYKIGTPDAKEPK